MQALDAINNKYGKHYLGHESPEITARYAHTHDETLKTAFNNYQSKLVDIYE